MTLRHILVTSAPSPHHAARRRFRPVQAGRTRPVWMRASQGFAWLRAAERRQRPRASWLGLHWRGLSGGFLVVGACALYLVVGLGGGR